MSRIIADTFETTAELERDLLGTLLLCSTDSRCADAYAALDAQDFHDPAHRRAWAVLGALSGRGEPPVVGTLLAEAECQDWSPREALGMFSRLLDCFGEPSALPWLCRHVRERRRRREIVSLGEEIAAVGAGTSSSEVSADAQQRLAGLADLETADHPRTAREWIVARGFDDARGLPVVWPGLAEILRRWWDGWLYVIGGRPSQGKTALCVNVALRAVEADVPVCFESLEMNGQMLVDRLTAILSGVSVSRQLEIGNLRDREVEDILVAHQKVAGLPLTIHAGASHRLDQILARVRAWRLAIAGDGPALVVVDYVGLVDAGKGRTVDQVSAVSHALKNLAGQLKLPILACCQLNRGVEQREDFRSKRKGKDAPPEDPERPRLSDLRDSGSLEQDADAVVMLYGLERGKSGFAKLAVEKQRQGPTGDVKLYFNAGLTRFDEEAPDVLV